MDLGSATDISVVRLCNYLQRKQDLFRFSMTHKEHVNSISVLINPLCPAVPAARNIPSIYRHLISLCFQTWCHTTHLLVTATKPSPVPYHLERNYSKNPVLYKGASWQPLWSYIGMKTRNGLAVLHLSFHLCLFVPQFSPCFFSSIEITLSLLNMKLS